MKQPRKHAELIRAWADGAVIQFFDDSDRVWRDALGNQPMWLADTEYRIKPEPKPDMVRDFVCEADVFLRASIFEENNATLRLTFDGETGKLKDAEVLK